MPLLLFPSSPPPPRFSSSSSSSSERGRRTTVSAAAPPCRSGPPTMYELLSVKETATKEEIKAAFRRQARRWHPDACPASGDKGFFAQKFMRAREAYKVLSDPELREGYDSGLRAAQGRRRGAVHGAWRPG